MFRWTVFKSDRSTLGFNKNGQVLAYTGKELTPMEKPHFTNVVKDGSVFARVAPEQLPRAAVEEGRTVDYSSRHSC